MSAREFQAWKVWFKHEGGGTRTPTDELIDLFAARSLAAFINANVTSGWQKTPRDLMVWPPAVTQEEVEASISRSKKILRGMAQIIRGNCGKRRKP